MSQAVTANPLTAMRPSVLVVDDEPTLVELFRDVLPRQIHCKVLAARNLREARDLIATNTIELLVTDVRLPDGDGMSLLPALRKHQPQATAIVITGQPSVDGAISALRNGALDFVPKPFSADQLVERVRKALQRQSVVARTEKRLARLKVAVRRLNESRRLVSKKVDLLCNDLVTAYGELSKELDVVRTQEGFRKFIGQANDLEQLLCHMMDWTLRQVGYSNVGVWLASDDDHYELGAYMKYTLKGEQALTDAMRDGIVKKAAKDGFVHLVGDEVQEKLTPKELDYLADQEVLAVNCTYLGEVLAVVVLFRDGTDIFADHDVTTIKSISPLFAVALASMVKGAEKFQDPDAADDDAFWQDEPDAKNPPKKDPSDWWKRGESPPF